MIQSKIPIDVVLLGPPASGKGTIARAFKDKYNWYIVTTGDIYRKLRQEDSEIGAIVRDTLEKYHHCPDDLTDRIVHESTQDIISINNLFGLGSRFALDGYPRSIAQLDYLDQHYDVKAFLHIDAPFELLFEASINRRYCKGCRHVFSAKNPPCIIMAEDQASRPFMTSTCLRSPESEWPEKGYFCAAEGKDHWEIRWDDGEEKYRERIEAFNEKTIPVIKAVSQRANYRKFQALDNPNALREIEEWLDFILGPVC